MVQARDVDLSQIDVAGLAAFWLTLKKMIGSGKNFKPLQQEAEYVADPFVRHLLDICFGDIEEPRIRILAKAKADTLLSDKARRFDLMRVCLLDMLNLENPHRTLAKMMAQYTQSPATGATVLKRAQALLRLKPQDENAAGRFDVSDHLPDEALVTRLIFYSLLVRHKDKMACQEYVPLVSSHFFRDGLALIIDGFEEPFVRRWLRVHRQASLDDAAHKMQMCTELALGIRARFEYSDMERIARSFL